MAQAQEFDVTRFINEQKISSFHVRLIILCFLVVLIDGYDIGAVAFAGPALVREFHLNRAQLGPVFAAGLFAGLFGPPVLGYFADHFGRRTAVIVGIVFFGVFTVASVWVGSIQQLIYLRFIAGLGIAGVLATVVPLITEFAPQRARATMFVLMFCGVTFGGGLPGFVAARFMATEGWRLLFWIGGLLPIVLAVFLYFVLPELVKYLTLRPERQAELAQLLRRINPSVAIPAGVRFVLGGEENAKRFSFKAIFAGRLALVTPLFWIVNAVNLMVFYFVNQWMPTILSNAGISVEHAAIATTLFQFGGTAGGLVIMRPLDKYGFLPVPILFAIAIPIIFCIGLPGLSEPVILTLVTAAGFCLLGLQFGNIATENNVYPTALRSFGVGSCFGAGRVGSVFGPVVGGILIGMNVSLQHLFYIAAIPLVLGLIAAVVLAPIYRANYHLPGLSGLRGRQ